MINRYDQGLKNHFCSRTATFEPVKKVQRKAGNKNCRWNKSIER